MRTFLALVSILLRLAGMTLIIFGLWFSSGGLRMIVSGRLDERNAAARSLKLGLPLLGSGIVLVLFGMWMENHI